MSRRLTYKKKIVFRKSFKQDRALNRRKTIEEFIEDASAVHGDRYDYSKSRYETAHTKIEIICQKHGSFWQTPTKHTSSGRGCPICGKESAIEKSRRSTKDFIKIANKVHKKRYDYSEVEYVNAATKVKIICPDHGPYWQTPACHTGGQHCPQCSNTFRSIALSKGREQFIIDAKAVHSDRYDYSEVEYVNGESKVNIICPEHGPFLQSPVKHLVGKGCPPCGLIRRADSRRKHLDDFIEEASAAHDDRYDYSEIEYHNLKSKVKIICPDHGPFWQTPTGHLAGKGCWKCGAKASADSKRKDIEDFIEEANAVHDNRYDYSKVNYINALTKVKIICPDHGVFASTPMNHLIGRICPKCAKEQRRLKNEKKFLENANYLFSRRYDYSQMKYVNSSIKITIICPIHGPFEQKPVVHLNSNGCKICQKELKELGYGKESTRGLSFRS